MKFRANTYTLRPAWSVEVKTAELIDFFLVMLGEPVIRTRESLLLFELHIRRSKRKLNKPLRDVGGTRRRRVFQDRRISQWKRLVSGFHGSIPNWLLIAHSGKISLPIAENIK